MENNFYKNSCKNCQKDFTIEIDDSSFYNKIKVPTPSWCPDCRQQRRYAWRNERTLYRRNCDLCGESTVTIYSPNKKLKVYCLSCWWSDKWDPSSYGIDFNFSQTFFEQYKELQKVVPRMALLNKNSVNSDYANHSVDNKNSYLSFNTFRDEDVYYCTYMMHSKNCMDSSYIYEGGENLYECIESRKLYNSEYCFQVKNSMDCYYCYDCRNCSNCFLSFNQRNKSYVFKNQQLTKEEYLEKIKEYDLSSYKTRQELYKEFIYLMSRQAIHKAVVGENNINTTGSGIYDCKNSKYCFDTQGTEDSNYIFGSDFLKNSLDCYHIGFNNELVYESHACKGLYDCQFCHLCYDNQELKYCDTCHNSSNLFGCISIKKDEYMIFNKKYTKGQYLDLKEKIINHMIKTGEYGEFFPPQISPVCYNETQGHYYMPLTKKEVVARGWLWEDEVSGVFGKETIQPENISDSIKEFSSSIIKEVLKCVVCSKNYNFIKEELDFYRHQNIPLPRECPDCRYKRRFDLRLPRKLWDRKCMKCDKNIKTAYSPGRPEMIYCEECYKMEIY